MNRGRALRHLLLAAAATTALLLALTAAAVPVGASPPVPPSPTLPPSPALHATPAFPRPALAASRPRAPLGPDLSIHFISRSPRYPRYCLDYSRDLPDLCAGSENDRHFPAPGEPVTFTARLANQGDAVAAATPFTWTLDGGVLATGHLAALAAGETVDLTLPWLWQSGSHTLTLALAGEDREISRANNRLDSRTDAHYLEVLVHPYFVQAFVQRQNLVGSYAFADWIQAQFAQLNQRLAAAVYPDLPAGLPDRVRIDTILVTEAVGGDTVTGDLAFDGRWSFRPDKDLKRTPENEAWESAQRYAAHFAAGIDWGLIHELGHQLGLIDLYQLNVSPSAGNLVHDGAGLPLLSGFYWPQSGLMGGDVSPAGATYFSEHSALALAANSGFRRGYFGEYLYDLPAKIRVRVGDNAGRPLAGVHIAAFQTQRNVLQAAPVFQTITGGDGVALLPNRPVSATLTTATGHTLHDNPFGRVDVVGRNGQLLLHLRYGQQEAWRWLPITDLNKAAWRGETALRLDVDTLFSTAALPSPRLSLRTAGDQARLTWQPLAEAAAYNLYQADWPRFDSFRLLAAGITTTTASVALTTTARFAVAAVAGDGQEGPLSPPARGERVVAPAALVWERQSPYSPRGQITVVDGHSGALLRLLPPAAGGLPAWLGRMGSEHHGQVGAAAASLGADGVIVTALGEGRVWLFDPDLRPLNWFGRIGDRPSLLDQPAGVALAGAPLDLTLPLPWPDPQSFLLLPFDGDLIGRGGQAPALALHLSFVPGRQGQAVQIAAGGQLQYAAAGFPVERGSVAFWVQPRWPALDKQPHVLLEIGDPARDPEEEEPGYLLRLAHSGEGGLYVWVTDFGDFDRAAWGEIADWQAGEWHHVAASWEAQRLNLHVDGRLLWAEALPEPITGAAPLLAVGSALNGEFAADAAFDELRISTLPRLGNSDAARVLVAEAQPPALKVFDLMGNLRRTTPLPGLTPGELAVDAGGAVWLADVGGRRLHRFRLVDDALVWAETLPVLFAAGPQALAASADGLLAVAAGDQVFLLDPARPEPVLRVWDGPNDGSPGAFAAPAALAFGPQGDLAVAEAGNRRVSFIFAAAGAVVWLPRVTR